MQRTARSPNFRETGKHETLNTRPGEKDGAAKDAGIDFAIEVGEFEDDYGRTLRELARKK